MQRRSGLIRQFLLAAAEIHQRDVTPETAAAYESALAEIPLDDLRRTLNQTLRDEKFWPTPGHVMERFRKAAAERAWSEAQDRLARWAYDPGSSGGPWLPVFSSKHPGEGYRGRVEEHPNHAGFLLYPEPVSEATEMAVRHVGGWQRLRLLTSAEHDFVRRDFCERHGRARMDELALPAGSAEKLLDRMPAELVGRALK